MVLLRAMPTSAQLVICHCCRTILCSCLCMTRAGQGENGLDFLHREFDKVGALWTELCLSVVYWNTCLQYDGIWGLCLGDEQASMGSSSLGPDQKCMHPFFK